MREILDLAKRMKIWRGKGSIVWPVDGLLLAMIFEKQSLRTRVSFEAAFRELGGHAVYLTKADIDMGAREPIADIAKVLSSWCSIIVARVKRHDSLVELASHATVPVVNALSDEEHPCQALADMLTIEEHFGISGGRKIAWIGDGNNVANSFAVAGAALGYEVVVCTPEGYEPSAAVLTLPGISLTHEPAKALDGAAVVSTDVWISMGNEDEEEARMRAFAGFRVDGKAMFLASPGAIFMHCLPARRGLEVASEVIDGPQSVVFQQAENRLHAQKALMKLLLDGFSEQPSLDFGFGKE
jgi:ornithine carbamoyltransferase